MSALPALSVIQPVDFEAEKTARLTTFTAAMRVNYPEYNTPLPSDPAYQLISSAVYKDQLNRQQANEAIASNFILFAQGADLDQLAITPPFNVLRMEGENDDAFRSRVQLRIRGWAPGTLDYYEFIARSAATGIKAVVPDVDNHPVIRLSVMADNDSGIPTEAQLTAIAQAVNAKGVKLNSDVLQVVSVNFIPVDLAVTIQVNADFIVLPPETLQARFTSAFNAYRQIGKTVAKSWIMAQHQLNGVDAVLTEYGAPEVSAHQCLYLASYSLTVI